ncbi:MAG TPA: uracil-DNA glycosylase, partial [Acidimicrobiia bacterium]|nr:uracil-DNA glycosylase [Acidimicrobiia bacterium]
MSLLEPPPFASWADLEHEALACTKCPLAETRTQVVFGVGDPRADLLFVGEGPGEQEDLTGEPFVGRAGRLLTSLIEGIGLTRSQTYIANVVKCRPPGNRDPLPLEIESCSPYL